MLPLYLEEVVGRLLVVLPAGPFIIIVNARLLERSGEKENSSRSQISLGGSGWRSFNKI